VITRALGTKPDVDVYLTSAQLHAGDTLVLCTDGLHTLVSEQEMRDIVEHYTPEESAKRLIALANENGGPDNITAIVVQPERIPA
jgi:protein phosphatase